MNYHVEAIVRYNKKHNPVKVKLYGKYLSNFNLLIASFWKLSLWQLEAELLKKTSKQDFDFLPMENLQILFHLKKEGSWADLEYGY